MSRISALHDPGNAGKLLELRELRAGAAAAGVTIDPVELRTAEDVERSFATMAQSPPHALIVLTDGVTTAHQPRIVANAARLKLPAIYQDSDFIRVGGLMSYGLNVCQHFARSAHHVDRILRGAKPADLPAELPTTFELAINVKTARELGITLPPTLIALADEVIE